MIYSKEFTLPANTAIASPRHATILVSKGLVYRVEFQFPAGCAGLAGLIVSDGGFQIWPSSLGEWFVGDDQVIAFDDMYLKSSEPWQFDLWGFNLDDTYPHTLYIRIGLSDREIFQARYLPNVAYDLMQKELKAAQVEQEAKRQSLVETPFPWLKKGEKQ